MRAQSPSIRARFGVALLCAFIAVSVYLPAEAKATAFHDFYRHFIHPWGSTSAMVVILAFFAVSLVAAISVLHRSSAFQRIAVIVVLLAPLLIVARFLFWVMHQFTA